jgi:ABC-type multidrug transport system ATPase subunit
MEMAEGLCDRVGIIDEGVLLQKERLKNYALNLNPKEHHLKTSS